MSNAPEKLNARTLLHEQNPISLQSAFVQERSDVIYLVLLPHGSSMPECHTPRKSCSISMYRHKSSRISELLYVLRRDSAYEGLYASPEYLVYARKHGKFRMFFRQMAHRIFLTSYRRGIKVMTFKKLPQLRLIWSESGHSVGVLLDEEPWAFIHEEKNRGYSKGVLNVEAGNLWDQGLFEKTFETG
jgi:hypothetical protein